jgi:hypothetical protein
MSDSDTYNAKITGPGLALDVEVSRDVALRLSAIALGAEAGESPPPPVSPEAPATSGGSTKRKARTSNHSRGAGRRPPTPNVVRDLSLRPSGKPAFAELVAEKQPKNHPERQLVSVYYLSKVLAVDDISMHHVNTCYVDQGWKRPANFENSLQVTAARSGWLDTSDMDSIKITTRGEDAINHELPRES